MRDLRQLRTLEKLSIKAATIRSFDVLRNFTTLRGLWFEDVNVNDRMLAHIAGLTRLEELGLEGTRVTKLAPLSRLTRLLILNLEESPVRSLRSLRKLTRLQQIFLSGTKVKKGSCRRLQRINKTLEINDCP